ncbi:MAG: tetratricopeptide repeat protein [Candidatus Thorarchaeota archaeon]
MGMKPLGTITMYYPFIDEETIDVIQTIMDDASSYYDFVEKLSEKVYESDVPETLAYIAAVHAWRVSATGAIQRISKKFGSIPTISAWTTPLRKLPYEEMKWKFEEIISNISVDWILAELLFLKCWCGRYSAPFTDVEKNIEQAESFFEFRPDLECFLSAIYTVKGEWQFAYGDIPAADEYYDRVMEIAHKYDDQFQIYLIKTTYPGFIRTYDSQRALMLQEEAYQMAKRFEAPEKIAETLSDLGRIFETRGEYDLAIRAFNESLETFGSYEMEWYREPGDTPAFGLSRVYCELEDGKNAIEWINTAFELAGPSAYDTPYMISQKAEALILVGNFREAVELLDLCNKLSLKAARLIFQATCGLATGLLELIQGDPLTAIQTLEPCLESVMSLPLSIYINRILIALAKAEIASNLSGLSEISEKWLSRLGRHALEKDLPGIFLIYVLLKAEFIFKQGLSELAISTLEEVIGTYDSPSVRTLIERVHTKISEYKENKK